MALKLSLGTVEKLLGKSTSTPAGAGLGEIFELGVIKIYGSPRPASASDAETGTLLCTITDAAGTYTEADGTNGLSWEDPDAGVLAKSSSQTWSGVAVATGTAVWGRFYEKGSSKTGADDGTKARIDFSVGTSSADLNMSSVAIASGATQSIDSFSITLPNGE